MPPEVSFCQIMRESAEKVSKLMLTLMLPQLVAQGYLGAKRLHVRCPSTAGMYGNLMGAHRDALSKKQKAY